jgi:hypothetical protein
LKLDIILLLWEGILLERNIFLLSQSKNLLFCLITALLSLIFPFKWEQTIIHILPEKLRIFNDSPIPSIIGICFKVDLSEFPPDALVVNVDKSTVEKYFDKFPKLPQKQFQIMLKKLEKYHGKYMNPLDLSKLEFCDEAFTVSMDIQEEDKDFDAKGIREIFYEFFVSHFKSYEKYFGFKNKKNTEKLVFNKEIFLKDHFSTDV